MFRSKWTQALPKWRQLDAQLPAVPLPGMSAPSKGVSLLLLRVARALQFPAVCNPAQGVVCSVANEGVLALPEDTQIPLFKTLCKTKRA